ncbi:menaquinone reductase iron-sulfur cluster-binding subunit QrcC [Pseudodesulfovibrio indicus]|jgi:molybdopterin-containing oxidoreductase family iron-sulfur binding subunit|uniref:Molybdopterin oxidoreductase n=1 Tax=Pseudodesulfovibrio indicus TaxID=1716143 RepID=A0A126QQ99_9BACT|nr:menaquinone reductase iron-sulfur cluster-binding subunit QrcC [Pseudodesulfovibrio indicus]AMK12112.1 molybdopterin oxidoreductase [Pseudodesulfovibrio indicus]TDT88713.1 molybdopterin-containing oxidoreductase family iron-sulfur binding subunit [Pseudodesulfovibrio indicus]
MQMKEFKIKWGMVIDIDKCTGCGACMVGCQVENNIAPMTKSDPYNYVQALTKPRDDASNKLRTLTWMNVYELSNGKAFPEHETAYLPRPCMQCGNPACVPVCPVVATDKNEEGGIVSQIYPRCIGCRYCMAACPYHARYFNWWDPLWPEGMDKGLSPSVSVRPRGVVEKCNFCHSRYLDAKNKARLDGEDPMNLADGAYNTACAEICPTKAITFGDLNNPEHAVHELAKSPNAFRLLEKLGLHPQVYYMSEREWVRKQGDNYNADAGGHH